MVFKLEASVMLVNFLLWVKWVLRNAKTVLSFVITLKSAKKSKEWEEPKERGRAGQEDPPRPGWCLAEGGGREGRELPLLLAVSLQPASRDTKGCIRREGRRPGGAPTSAGLSHSWPRGRTCCRCCCFYLSRLLQCAARVENYQIFF